MCVRDAIVLNKRSYQHKDEINRNNENRNRNQTLQLQPSYIKVCDENLWNTKLSLSPRLKRYHRDENTFRKSPVDLDYLRLLEKQQKLDESQIKTKLARSLALKRQELRSFENKVIQHKSSQRVDKKSAKQFNTLEQEDPQLFEDIMGRKKWNYIQKDPSRALRDSEMGRSQILNHLNHLPQPKVELLTDQKVLKRDMLGCQSILRKMYQDFYNDDIKLQLRKNDREEQRIKLAKRHEQVSQLEQLAGIRLGQTSKKNLLTENSTDCLDKQASNSNIKILRQQTELSSSEASTIRPHFNLKFDAQVTQTVCSPHLEVLAKARPENKGKDLFQRPEFRGLILSDFQGAIGDKAKDKVEELNRSSVSKFPQLSGFQESFRQRKQIEQFYKTMSKSGWGGSPERARQNQSISVPVTKYGRNSFFETEIKKENPIELNVLRKSQKMWNQKIFQTLDHSSSVDLKKCVESTLELPEAEFIKQEVQKFEQRNFDNEPRSKPSAFPGSRISQKNFYNLKIDFNQYGKPEKAPCQPRQKQDLN